MYLHKLLFINDLFPLVLDPRLPSSVCFNIMFISLENFGASSDGDQEFWRTNPVHGNKSWGEGYEL